MDIALWVAQAVLSLVFLGAGFSKLRTDHVTFAASSPPNSSFAEDLSERTFTTIGVLEVLGAVGVLLPWALDVTPVVTPVAAVGLAALMVGAIATHLRRGERQPVVVNVVLLVLAVAVAVGRGLEVMS